MATIEQRSSSFRGVTIRNQLSNDIKAAISLVIFKNDLFQKFESPMKYNVKLSEPMLLQTHPLEQIFNLSISHIFF